MPKICFFSVDVEPDFGQDGFIGVEHLTDTLDIFDRYDIPATLFVTGEALAAYKESFESLAGVHEIACHGFSHRFWNVLPPGERIAEIERFKGTYQEMFGKEPKGFRAPSHLMDEAGMEILEENNFTYDSSVVPHYPFFKKYRGYQGPAPQKPYYPSFENIRQPGNMAVLEIPNTGHFLGIPLAGAWIAKLPLLAYQTLFALYEPRFISLAVHSWNVLDNPIDKNYSASFLQKLDGLVAMLKKRGYQFLTGEQIANDYSKLFGN